jgi:hypothetical protein
MDPNLGDLSMTRMKLGWSLDETKQRSEPTDVEESADELLLGVKCHSNPELAAAWFYAGPGRPGTNK